MHNCEEFRERITEHIIDREDVTADPRFEHELLVCSSCCEFYVNSCDMMNALASVDAHVDTNFGDRHRILELRNSVSVPEIRWRRSHVYGHAWQWAAAAAALLLITAGLVRFPAPQKPLPVLQPASVAEQPLPLDPVTVDFLQQSELLLRNVVKMAPNDTKDLENLQRLANEQLLSIDQRKDAAAQLPTVLNVMDTYETVLRDIRNVNVAQATDDVPDIQNRIQRDGLIANIRAFQPRATTVSFTGRGN